MLALDVPKAALHHWHGVGGQLRPVTTIIGFRA